MLKFFIPIFIFSSAAFAQQKNDSENFEVISRALKYWLQDATFANVGSLPVKDRLLHNKNISKIMLHNLLKSNDDWEVYYKASYDQFGNQIPLVIGELEVDKNKTSEEVLLNGYYFIQSKDKKYRLAVTPVSADVYYQGDGYLKEDRIDIVFNRKDRTGFEAFRKSLVEQTKRNHLYEYSVLEFTNDGFQANFLDNIDQMGLDWDNLILKKDLKDAVEANSKGYLNLVKYFKKNNIKSKKGLLLEGPPGTGKSLLGQVLISSIHEGDLKDKSTMIIVTARHLTKRNSIRRLFEVAREMSPSIVFIEDIDLLGVKTRKGLRNDDDKDTLLNEFLNGIDGVISNDGILVIGTTNEVQNVDPALRRSLRLGMHFHFGLPDESLRARFFEAFSSKGSEWDKKIDAPFFAKMTLGLSGADLVELIALAKLEALIGGSEKNSIIHVKMEYFLEALRIIKQNHGDDEFDDESVMYRGNDYQKHAKNLESSLVKHSEFLDSL